MDDDFPFDVKLFMAKFCVRRKVYPLEDRNIYIYVVAFKWYTGRMPAATGIISVLFFPVAARLFCKSHSSWLFSHWIAFKSWGRGRPLPPVPLRALPPIGEYRTEAGLLYFSGTETSPISSMV